MPTDYDKNGANSFIDYRATRCRCRSVVQPNHLYCLHCGRKQNLLFDGLDKIHTQDLWSQVKVLEEEISKRPYDYIKMQRLAGVMVLLGKFGEAVELYRKILEKKPDLTSARLNMGVALAATGEDASAIAELTRYIHDDAHSPRAERVLRALCSLKKVPYEDGMLEKTRRQAIVPVFSGKKGSTRVPDSASVEYGDKRSPKVRIKRGIGPIDIVLLLVIIGAAAGWYMFPSESRNFLDKVISTIEAPLSFSVRYGRDNAGTSGTSGEDENRGNNADEKTPINLNPATDSYFPLAGGNRWEFVTYDSRNSEGVGNRESTGIREMSVTGLANAEKGVWRVNNSGVEYFYVERTDGIFTTDSSTTPWGGLICVVPYPPTIGYSVETHGQTVTVIGEEDVQTSAGLIRCVKLHYTLGADSGIEWWSWYGKGVGLVKYVGGGRDGTYHVLELREFSLN